MFARKPARCSDPEPLDPGTIGRRLDRLERENRRLKGLLAFACVGILTIVAGGAALREVPERIEAREFILRAKDGKVLASLSVNPGKGPQLVFCDGTDFKRMILGDHSLSFQGKAGWPDRSAYFGFGDDGGTHVSFWDDRLQHACFLGVDGSREPYLRMLDRQRGGNRIHLRIDGEGNPGIAILGTDQKATITLKTKADGSSSKLGIWGGEGGEGCFLGAGTEFQPYLRLVDPKLQTRLQLNLDEHDAPRVELYDAKEQARVSLWTAPDGLPGLSMFHADDGPLSLGLGAWPGEGTGLKLFDPKGKDCATLLARPDGTPLLKLSDKDGKVLHQAP